MGIRLSAEECAALADIPAFCELKGQLFREWRKVQGCEDYEVSEYGEVRRGSRLLKLTESKSRHQFVTLYGQKGGQWRVGVHRLVAIVFHGPAPKGKPFACHRNGRAWDNHRTNIYWGSRDENVADMMRHASLKGGVSVEIQKSEYVNTAGSTT